MVRPKGPEDPEKHPEPCARCGEHRELAVRWPDGKICHNCRRKAFRTKGECSSCGHQGVLPGVSDDGPTCRTCSGISINVDCVSCGAEDDLYAQGQCWRCALGRLVDDALTDPSTGVIAQQLQPFAEALKTMPRANSGLTWIRQPHVQRFLESLATSKVISHTSVDELPASNTREYVRALLVEVNVLPRRDDYLVRFENWIPAAQAALASADHHDVLARFVRWDHLRKMSEKSPVSRTMFLTSKQTVTVAVDFLNWLTKEGIALEELAQDDLDAWATSGKSTRLRADRFLNFARRTRLVDTELMMRRHKRGSSKVLSLTEQRAAGEKVLDSTVMNPRDRVAATLILVFGQQVEDVTALRWRDVTISTSDVLLRLGGQTLRVPEPFDAAWRELRSSPSNGNTAANAKSSWVFPGQKPGHAVNPSYLADRLKEHFQARAARLGSLNEMTKLAPVTIIADGLGYASATLEAHAVESGATYARYLASVRQMADRAKAEIRRSS